MKSIDMKRIEYVLAGLLLLCSCQEKIDYWMTDAATATMDRIVGEYVLESIGWSLGPVDLDGDGMAYADFAKELFAAYPYRYEDYSRLTVDMDGQERYKVKVNWSCCLVEDIDYRAGRSYQMMNWRTFPVGGEIELDEDGNIVSFPYNSFIDYDNVNGRQEEVCYLRNAEYSFEDNDRLIFKAETAVFDYASDSVLRGEVTYFFKCVSGKGMVRQAHQPWFGRLTNRGSAGSPTGRLGR